MRDIIEEILLLQTEWVSTNTPDMVRRGELIRRDGADWLNDRLGSLQAAAGGARTDLAVKGKDGTGPKAEIPWIRIHSKAASPRATDGWYVVYLFDAHGERAYLSLNQGTTTLDGGDYIPREPASLRSRVRWAREQLSNHTIRTELLEEIDLPTRRSPLAAGYELGNVYAISYEFDAVPEPAQLHADAVYLCELLGTIYAAELQAPAPGDLAPEIAEVLERVDDLAGKLGTTGGQGRRQSAAERKAIEDRAMLVARLHFENEGWTISDMSRKPVSYDLHGTRDGAVLHIEVKGTVSVGETVILTRKEVDRQREHHPHNALAVVRRITLHPGPTPSAIGGDLHLVSPWEISDESIRPIVYTHQVTYDE